MIWDKSILLGVGGEKISDLMKYDKMAFNFANNSSSDQTINLFNGNETQTFNTVNGYTIGGTPTYAGRSALQAGEDYISDLVYSTGSNKIYALGRTTARIFVYSPNNYSLITTIITGFSSDKIAYCPTNNSIYVQRNASSNIYVYSCVTDALTTTIAVGGANLRTLTYVSSNNSIYAGCQNSVNTHQINCTTNTVTSTFATTVTRHWNAVYTSDYNRLFYIDFTGNLIESIDVSTNTSLGTLAVNKPIDITYDTFNQNLFISTNNLPYVVYVVNPSNLTLTTTITGFTWGLRPIEYDPVSRQVYTAEAIGGVVRVYIIDTNTLSISSSFVPYPTFYPESIAIDTVNNQIYFGFLKPLTPNMYNIYGYSSPAFINNTEVTSGSDDYDKVNKEIRNDPIIIRAIEYISNTTNQLNQGLKITYIDITGFQTDYWQHYNLQQNKFQWQNKVILIGDIILNGHNQLTQVLKAGESISYIFYYEQFKTSDLLGKGLINPDLVSINDPKNSYYEL